jgi:hypothetical protein
MIVDLLCRAVVAVFMASFFMPLTFDLLCRTVFMLLLGFVMIPIVNRVVMYYVAPFLDRPAEFSFVFCTGRIIHVAYEVGDTARLLAQKLQRFVDRLQVFFKNVASNAWDWYWRSFWIFYAALFELVNSPAKGLVGGILQRTKANLFPSYDWIVSRWDRIKPGEVRPVVLTFKMLLTLLIYFVLAEEFVALMVSALALSVVLAGDTDMHQDRDTQ